MRIAIVGNGRMGRAVAALAVERGHVIHTVVDEDENPGGAALTTERLRGADVAVEFTMPASAMANLERLIVAAIPTVTGTTGWTDGLPRIEEVVRRQNGALLHASNFSVGVRLFLKVAGELARRFEQRPEFDAFIVESHHAAKVDAPSGTALSLQGSLKTADPGRAFPITSVRAGAIPGTHSISYDALHETVALTHTARSREVFAAGALAAAEWLPGHRGVFTFDEMLFGRSE